MIKIVSSLANVCNANCITDLERRWSYVVKKVKTGQPSLNRYQGPNLDLIKSLRAHLDQNRVE
jgi:hypothetical protein